jgi:2-iminobutanoate/2-iminopropanoate deaminase
MSLEREVITGDGVPPTIGPYSPAVRAGGMLYVSGQAGIDPVTSEPAGGTSRPGRRCRTSRRFCVRAAAVPTS